MSTLYIVSVTIHILAAMLWVGGMGLFALVVVPVARRTLDQNKAGELLRAVGLRFGRVTWWILGTLLVTGIVNLAGRGLLPFVATTAFWRSSMGMTLAAKLGLVVLVTIVSAVHSRDAREVRAEATAAEHARARKRASMFGRATFLLSVAVVVLAVLLVRG